MGREQINVQDVGGENLHLEPPLADAIDASAKPTAYWEYQTHGLAYLLSQKGLWTTAAMRRAIENLPTAAYKNRSYYERWSAAIAAISLERGTFSQQELDEELGQDEPAPYVRYQYASRSQAGAQKMPLTSLGAPGRETSFRALQW